MKKNIVMIETEDSLGTGILYPCKYNSNLHIIPDYQTFIIFTNSHVLSTLGKNTKPNQNIKDFINLQFYDDNGEAIEKDDIKKVLVHNISVGLYNYDDVAALLVFIDNKIMLNIERCIYEKDIYNRGIIYTEGYPGVMLNDEVSQKVQLQGMSKDIFPVNEKIGVYQIKDDYHWYNNKKDLKLMEGFSGSPVYLEKENKTYLIGMNQSVANISDGENPFKLVYYIKIEHVIKHLRETGCIIFRKKRNNSYLIEWVDDRKNEIEKWENEITFLMIGGSGAGKSSLAKNFAYHKDMLNVTNDGQTTRTNVLYRFSIFCEQPNVEVYLLSKDEFVKKMETYNGVKLYNYIFNKLLGFSKNTPEKDELIYLKDCYYILEKFEINKRGAMLDKIEELLMLQEADQSNEDIDDIYKYLLTFFLKKMPISIIKYVCDRTIICDIRKEYSKQTAYFKDINENCKNRRDILKQIIKKKWGNDDFTKIELYNKIEEIMYRWCEGSLDKRKNNIMFKDYQEHCYRELFVQYDNSDFYMDNYTKLAEIINEQSGKEDFIKYMFKIEGFFDLSEFNFLSEYKKIMGEIFEIEDILNVDGNIDEKKRFDLKNDIEPIYKYVYDKLIDALKRESIIKEPNQNKFEIFLLDKDKRELLTYCLQVKNGNSLTGIVKSVNINDRISNEYVMLLNDMKIKKMQLLDTCGLDHIVNNKKLRNKLLEIVEECINEKEIKYEDINILYLKKLDSGKPDELRIVLPEVYNVIPRAPIYCLFSGIDIFYHNNSEKVRQINWTKWGKNCPKAVKYLLSDEGSNELLGDVKGSKNMRNNLYIVMKNNLIPYCGQEELVASDINYYENNIKYIRKLLISIIRKEYSSLDIVDINRTREILKEKKKNTTELLGKIFERASIHYWRYYKTAISNYNKITGVDGDYKLGFERTFRHKWNQLFYDAYTEIIRTDGGKYVDIFESGKAAIEAALANMVINFLGKEENLYDLNLSNEKKNDFRNILENMYEAEFDNTHEKIYNNNPFSKDKVIERKACIDYNTKKKYLLDTVDFAKGFRGNKTVQENFIEIFEKTLMEQIEKDNKAKVTSLIEINSDFANTLAQLKKDFSIKYSVDGNVDNEKSVEMFNKMMRDYFTK